MTSLYLRGEYNMAVENGWATAFGALTRCSLVKKLGVSSFGTIELLIDLASLFLHRRSGQST